MEKSSELAKRFFLFLETESAMLMRIEFLVVVITLLYQVMFFLDLWRRRSRSSVIKYILVILDAIADSTFLYTIGLMQSAPFKIDLFVVWALILVNLRFSGCFISAYGMPDHENRRISELANVMALLGVAFLNGTRNSQFKHPIWALWTLQVVRSFYLIFAYNLALTSSLHGRSSTFLMVGMPALGLDHADESDNDHPEVNLGTMEGYKYPVSGDQKKKFKVEAPSYNFDVNITGHEKVLTTLETIWKPDGLLENLKCTVEDIKLIKDMCLSFSLYRLLRCRFDDLALSNDVANKTRRLMCKIMEGEDASKRTFRIVESEIAFLNDYFYTRYPVLFFRGLPHLATLHPLLTIAFTCWLGRDIHRLYNPRTGETAHVYRGVNVDLIITWAFMVVVVMKEFWKMLTYVLSDWTKVMILCEYVAENLMWLPKCIREKLVWLLCTPRFKMVERWHRQIDQYEFIQSYVYNPCKWNILFYLTLGLCPKGKEGVKLGKSIDLPEEVKDAVLKSLSLCSQHIKQGCLQEDDNNGLPSLTAFLDRYQTKPRRIPIDWTPLIDEIKRTIRHPTCSHTILIWHIATSLCEIDLAQHYNTSLTDSEVLSALKSAKSCFSAQTYMIKIERLERALRANYTAANSISRYCAYLLVTVPELLPDSFFVPELVLKSTIREASKILEGCDTLQSKYRRLMREAVESEGCGEDDLILDDKQDENCCSNLPGISCFLCLIKGAMGCFCSGKQGTPGEENGERDDISTSRGESIIRMGARLGRLLIDATKDDDEARWELLAGIWADLLVHIAPSWNTEVHKGCLATGGEFITSIWAILSHCGVKESNLWQQQQIAGDDHVANQHEATGGHQDSLQQLSPHTPAYEGRACSDQHTPTPRFLQPGEGSSSSVRQE